MNKRTNERIHTINWPKQNMNHIYVEQQIKWRSFALFLGSSTLWWNNKIMGCVFCSGCHFHCVISVFSAANNSIQSWVLKLKSGYMMLCYFQADTTAAVVVFVVVVVEIQFLLHSLKHSSKVISHKCGKYAVSSTCSASQSVSHHYVIWMASKWLYLIEPKFGMPSF